MVYHKLAIKKLQGIRIESESGEPVTDSKQIAEVFCQQFKLNATTGTGAYSMYTWLT